MTENKRLYTLTAIAVAAMLVAAWMIFLYAPQDDFEGPVQRIFYLHVSTAIAAFVCFAIVLGGGVAYLWRESLRGDRLARAAALVGLVFTTNTFVMGVIWAKPIWNWDPSQTWDARLTSTAVLWAVYAGYLLVRRFATPGRPAMRLAAVVGIAGFVDVPVVYFSVQWWRTLHPGPVLASPGGPQLPAEMLYTWVATQVAVLLLTWALVAVRYRIEARRDEHEEREVAAQLEVPPPALARHLPQRVGEENPPALARHLPQRVGEENPPALPPREISDFAGTPGPGHLPQRVGEDTPSDASTPQNLRFRGDPGGGPQEVGMGTLGPWQATSPARGEDPAPR